MTHHRCNDSHRIFANRCTKRIPKRYKYSPKAANQLKSCRTGLQFLVVIVLLVFFASGCERQIQRHTTTSTTRPASSALSEEDARHRSSRVSNVSYKLNFELDGKSEDFSGHVDVRFDLSEADTPLTLDFAGGDVHRVVLNEAETKIDYNGQYITLASNELRNGSNTLTIEFSHPYSNDGSGLYRFRDPVDGHVYLYTDFEPYDANRLFPCFDQPDLKATYATEVTVPADWEVISIVQETLIEDLDERRRWVFPDSAPISTYIYALHAGNYVSWQDSAGDIPLRLFARASLADYVRTDDWFIPTKQGFRFFQTYFDIPYPFGKYDQIIVPHFNAGAMENLGAVTYSERFLTRGKVTRSQRRSLASVIMHEMAHMWFGNLVTMDWWNGLWLNEAFATFMANLALEKATEFHEVDLSAFRSNISAYRADERDTTHPIEQPTPNTDAAFAIFDAITYNKGSAVLAQLRYLVGPDKFREGVSAYLKRHAYDNTTIDDFLSAIAESADMDLTDWAASWLNQPGTNSVSVQYTCEENHVSSLILHQQAPVDWPTLRTHRTQLGLYSFSSEPIRQIVFPATYAGSRTEVPIKTIPCPDAIYPNHGNWDFVRVELDKGAMHELGRHINEFDDPLQRSMLWYSMYEMVLYQRMSPGEFIRFTLELLPSESNEDVTRQVLGSMMSAWSYVRRLEPEATVRSTAKLIERFVWKLLLASDPGTDRQLLLFDSYTSVVTSDDGLARLAEFLAEGSVPNGIQFDQDRRWSVLQKLSGHGHPNTSVLLEQETANDTTDAGRLRALSVRAARPDPTYQEHLVALLLDPPRELTVYEARAHARGLFPFEQQEAQLQHTNEVFSRLQALSDNVDSRYHGAIVGGLLGNICDERYLDQLGETINDSSTLHPSMRKRLLDMRFQVRRCLSIGKAMTPN